MPHDMKAIIESKQRYARELAALPVAEKLRMLDALRERTVTLQAAGRAYLERRDAERAAGGVVEESSSEQERDAQRCAAAAGAASSSRRTGRSEGTGA